MRTTADAIKAICEVDTGVDLSPFIESANALIEEICAPLGYNDTRLELIERWLSAHFYTIQAPRVSKESVSQVSASYEGVVDLHLNNSKYGQHALVLDTKGGLAAWNNAISQITKQKIGITWIGKDPCE